MHRGGRTFDLFWADSADLASVCLKQEKTLCTFGSDGPDSDSEATSFCFSLCRSPSETVKSNLSAQVQVSRIWVICSSDGSLSALDNVDEQASLGLLSF